jgi:FAD/FMN-containing dehydrogenase
MNSQQQAYLEKFGSRMTLNKTERVLYGHDIAAMPNLVKPLIGNTTPDAVVQPQNEEELAEVVRWAYQEGIPITPRGKASSGYGGVIPVKKGLVIDFYQMKDVQEVDEEGLTVTVQPGITWEQLDYKLKPRDLTLRLYPTSYPSSSVGGWLAQGGAGIGSYEYGYFRQNVVSARVVLPSGEVREFSGDELDLISDAEGITGLISQVTVRIQPREDVDVIALACPDAHEAQKLMQTIIDADLPIWSMIFINPRMAEMKNRAPLMEHYGHPVEERVLLPAAYILTLSFRAQDSQTVREALPELIKPCEAEILSDRIAHHEWEHRFKLMVVKRLGPSLVPAEVITPLSSLGDVMTEIERKVDQPVVKEGVIIREGVDGEPEAVILGFIPSDQRKFNYNFVFGLVLTIIKIAEKYGGRAYSTGLYFTKKADDVLGTERAERMRAFKKDVDPKGLLNPNKVIGNGLMGSAMSLASAFEPLIRPFGNSVITQVGERPTEPVRDIPPDVAWYAYACSQCG